MRPKFVLAVLLLAFLAVSAAVLLKQPKPPAKSQTPVPPVVVAPAAPSAYVPPPAAAPAVAKIQTPEEHRAAIDAEKDRLYTWSMSGDSRNLPNIVADLSSTEKEIRMAAIEATKQLGDTNAIPALKEAAAKTDDNEEAIAMLQAADFIALPEVTLTAFDGSQVPQTPQEVQAQAQSKAQAAARRQAELQRRAQQQAQGQQPNTSQRPPPSRQGIKAL